ncbi:hypothetical protein TTHERM_00930610 (macronuclear) [Tetrahymena thermophila SB210]|uniref:Uncharacterized protein n=1 Tax=Tetrahymena thermophila (strain SB210) TaxID=312017 RepID=Q24CI0_TETTS|nr:hypothetical protein TTHERM_00930610 [Tetrahymena thermophila SB210]EAS05480.1 hypothetical protein TTHERM_00930610 [Tetrahymena thermophila SB210]|eukprot:XP_001025725.1 hypothetical protein TTHERM_00930610 [Tetrahymena thermophila SB210]
MGFCSFSRCEIFCNNLNPFSNKKNNQNKQLPNYANNFQRLQSSDEGIMRQSFDDQQEEQKNQFSAELSFNNFEEEKKQETNMQNDIPPVNEGELLSQELYQSFQNTQLADLSKFVERAFDPTINLKEYYNQVQINQSNQPSKRGKSEYRLITFFINSVKYHLHAYKILLGKQYVDEYKKFKTLKDLHQQNDQNAKEISIKSISQDDCIIHYFLLKQQ